MSRHFGITTTDLYQADPELAERLWSDGFRPREMRELVKGNTVVFMHTMFGANMGTPGYATVLEVMDPPNEWTVKIKHTSGEAEEDECLEVWAKDKEE